MNAVAATAATATTAAAPADVPPAPKTVAAATEKKEKGKGKKDVYTGPNTIVVLPPTPMLDEQGMQRLDPDGKPMWNPPVKQQRDKKGHPLFDESGKPVFQTKTRSGLRRARQEDQGAEGEAAEDDAGFRCARHDDRGWHDGQGGAEL